MLRRHRQRYLQRRRPPTCISSSWFATKSISYSPSLGETVPRRKARLFLSCIPPRLDNAPMSLSVCTKRQHGECNPFPLPGQKSLDELRPSIVEMQRYVFNSTTVMHDMRAPLPRSPHPPPPPPSPTVYSCSLPQFLTGICISRFNHLFECM